MDRGSALWGWLQQLEVAAQGWSHLGCSAGAGFWCSGRDPGWEGASSGCSWTKELGHWTTAEQPGVGQDAGAGVAQVDLHWHCKGEFQLQGPSGKRCCLEMCLWSRWGLAHPVSGISIKITQVNEGVFLIKWGKAQQGQNQKWLYQATAQHHTPALLPWRAAGTDGAQSHGLKELSGCFRGMAHRLREWYLCVHIKRQERMYRKV